jgi:hypothetical protein
MAAFLIDCGLQSGTEEQSRCALAKLHLWCYKAGIRSAHLPLPMAQIKLLCSIPQRVNAEVLLKGTHV